MKIQFFSVNALEPAEDQVVIDDFCSRHRVVAIGKQLLGSRQFSQPHFMLNSTLPLPKS